MTSAYGNSGSSSGVNDGRSGRAHIAYLPLVTTLRDGSDARLDFFGDLLPPMMCATRSGDPDPNPDLSPTPSILDLEEVNESMRMLNVVIEDGLAWPFHEPYTDEASFRAYFLSHSAFIVRRKVTSVNPQLPACWEIAGTFYIKPNFPGRCSHICNGGFITDKPHRGLGVGTFMAESFVRLAKDLGYRASYFNLVFEENRESVKLWSRMGFQRVGTIPGAARLKGTQLMYTDAHQYYRDFGFQQQVLNDNPEL